MRRAAAGSGLPHRTPREPEGWLRLEHVTRNNLRDVSISFPLGVFTAVTGVSGSGKSSLVSQAVPTLVEAALGRSTTVELEDGDDDVAYRYLLMPVRLPQQ